MRQFWHYLVRESDPVGPEIAEPASQFNYKANSDVIINEICVNNSGSSIDEFNDDPDWIEIYNKGDTAINLKATVFRMIHQILQNGILMMLQSARGIFNRLCFWSGHVPLPRKSHADDSVKITRIDLME